jgi:hypothetical protein
LRADHFSGARDALQTLITLLFFGSTTADPTKKQAIGNPQVELSCRGIHSSAHQWV